jgi:HD superfamily phosphohydrolase
VQLTNRFKNIVDHPVFQRLSLVPQLELTYLLYPDARHTRFSHSLLTFHFCRLALAHMLADVEFRLAVDPHDIEATLLVALLHDIAHYPLSHMIEDLCARKVPGAKSDEELFEPVIRGLLPTGATRGLSPLLEMISGDEFGPCTEEAFWSIARCAHRKEPVKTPVHRVLAGLVSSAIDVDKVAYLRADSEAAGVHYGRGIDLHGFLSSLRFPPVGDEVEGGPVLGIDRKGITAAESIIMARYSMLSRVYWHHTNRAITAAFKFVILELRERHDLDLEDYVQKVFWQSQSQAIEELSQRFDRLSKKEYANPISGFRTGSRQLYSRFLTVSRPEDRELFDALIPANELGVADQVRDVLARQLGTSATKRGSVIVDIPAMPRDRLELERIVIVDAPGSGDKAQTLNTLSPLATNLPNEFLGQVKKARIFVHPDLAQELTSRGLSDKAKAVVRERLLE